MAATGANSKTGIALETTAGTQCVAQALLDVRSNSIAAEYNRVYSKALRPSRITRAGVMGAADVSGSLVCEVTPNKFSKALYAFLGADSVTGASDPYTHTMSPAATGPLPVTLSRVVGDLIQVNSGYFSRLALAAQLDELLLATLDFVGLNEKFTNNSVGNDTTVFGTASLPTLDPFVFTQGSVTLAGATVDVGSVTLTLDNGLSGKRRLGSAWPAAFVPGFMDIQYELDLYFDTETALRRALGDVGTSYPFQRTATNQTVTVVLTFDAGLTPNRKLTVTSTSSEITTGAPPVEGPDYIKQSVRVAGHGLSVALMTSETQADVTTAGTAIAWV